jgi:hypothetical protein
MLSMLLWSTLIADARSPLLLVNVLSRMTRVGSAASLVFNAALTKMAPPPAAPTPLPCAVLPVKAQLRTLTVFPIVLAPRYSAPPARDTQKNSQ